MPRVKTMTVYYTENLPGDTYVVYVLEEGDIKGLLKCFPEARRATRARVTALCRDPDRMGDWCKDAEPDPERIRLAAGDADVGEARLATYRAIELHEDFLRDEAEFPRPVARRPAPAFDRRARA